MRPSIVRWLLMIALIVAVPAASQAQEAVLTGTVTDATGAVLPGVTLTAVHEATGNTFETVTDANGSFRLAVRVGAHRVTAQLSGFQTVTRTAVQLLLGQQAAINIELAPASLQETVTVTGEAPLIDTAASTVAANIDPRQMEELPINGRNWMDLALLTPGARRNESGGYVQNRQGYSQTNVDGQQVTTIYHSAGDNEQPQWSRDSIAEFAVVANRFDATQGRSSGMVVNAITKSGTNAFNGTVAGYFRDDSFNAADLVAKRVLPYSNQQTSVTIGGPIIRDRLHFFAGYEYEREPKTFVYETPYPAFNMDLSFTDRAHKPLARVDFQITPQTRVWARVSGYNYWFHEGGGAITHPVNMGQRGRIASQYTGNLTQVLSSRSVNEIKGGATFYERRDSSAVHTWEGESRFALPPGARRRPGRRHPARVHHRRQSAEHHPEHRQRARRLHDVVRLARPPRPEDRRRVHVVPQRLPLVPAVHGHDRRHRRGRAGQHRGALPLVERLLDMEPAAADADHAVRAALADEHRAHLRCDASPALGVGAGRLAREQPADVEPWRPLRLGQQREQRAA